MMVSRWLAAAAVAGSMTAAAQAQTMSENQTLERGREVIALWWEGDGEALWATMTPEFQQQLGSIDPLLDSRDNLWEQFGEEAEVLEERVMPAGNNMAYWRVVELDSGPEPFVVHLVIQPDGLLALGRGGFMSGIGGPPDGE